MNDTTWDENVLQTFMANRSKPIIGKAYELTTRNYPSHIVGFYGTEHDHTRYASHVAIQVFEILEWMKIQRPIFLILWWREDPRFISANEWPSRKTVNGGWTRIGSNVICIFRSEEWDRVFFHELIHAMNWDWDMPKINDLMECWGFTSGRDKFYPAMFEAWTECLAEWLWCLWHRIPWSKQEEWQTFQAVQILARNNGKPWHEDTSVFAYYVLKAAIAPHCEKILQLHNNIGNTYAQKLNTLCMFGEELNTLRVLAKDTKPIALSLSMSIPQKLNMKE